MSKLKRFNKSNKKNIMPLVALCMIVAVVSAAISYAVYQKTDEIQFINARVGEFETTSSDIELVMTLDGEDVDVPPTIEEKENYTVIVTCDKADGSWDKDRWGANIDNIRGNRVKCEVNFNSLAPTMTEVEVTREKTALKLSYTVTGTNVKMTCKYGLSENNLNQIVEDVTLSNCNIKGLEMDTQYYYEVCAKNAGGEACKKGNVKTRGKEIADNVKIGDYIKMTPTSTSYTISTSLTGYSANQTINPSELNLWRVISKNDDGTIDIVSEYVSSTAVLFKSQTGYFNFVRGLNTIAAQYTNSKYVQNTRHMGYSNQKEICTGTLSYGDITTCPSDTEYKKDLELVNVAYGGNSVCTSGCSSLVANKKGTSSPTAYWIASRTGNSSSTYQNYNGRIVNPTGSLDFGHIYNLYYTGVDHSDGSRWAIRPIITIKSDVEIISGDGQSESTAYAFE